MTDNIVIVQQLLTADRTGCKAELLRLDEIEQSAINFDIPKPDIAVGAVGTVVNDTQHQMMVDFGTCTIYCNSQMVRLLPV